MIWTLLLDIDRALFWCFVILLVIGVLSWARGGWQTRFERPARQLAHGRVELRPSWFGISWFGMIAALMVTVAINFARHRADLVIIVPSCLLAGMLLFDIPRTIVVSSHGLEERYWLRKNKCIRWSQIVEIESDLRGRSVTIKAADGTRIVHSFVLSGRARFLQEIKDHCGEHLPADFPREPLEST